MNRRLNLCGVTFGKGELMTILLTTIIAFNAGLILGAGWSYSRRVENAIDNETRLMIAIESAKEMTAMEVVLDGDPIEDRRN